MGSWEDLQTSEINQGELQRLVAETTEPPPRALADGSTGMAPVYPIAPRSSRRPLIVVLVLAAAAAILLYLLR